MAALSRPEKANYEIHEHVKVDTTDFEDHTFCGIMFPICIKQDLPLDHLIIRSVAVRGYLGPMTVWISKPENTNPTEDYQYWDEDQWTRVYSKVHEPSRKTYQSLVFDRPVTLKGGEVRILYIHSTAPHDRAVVYDNSYFPTVERARYEDAFLKILSGKAHLSPTVFGQTPIWGWGSAWRPHREFVGQLEYGIVYQLWSPERHLSFGRNFQEAAHTIFGCQRRFESPVARLPDECIFYILNMCRWDWFEDDVQEMSQVRRGMRRIFSSSSSRHRRQPPRPSTQQEATEVSEEPRRRFRFFGFGSMRNALTASS